MEENALIIGVVVWIRILFTVYLWNGEQNTADTKAK